MNVLLVFTLLLLSGRWQIVVVLAAESLLNVLLEIVNEFLVRSPYQVVVGKVGNVTRLNAEVLEGLCLRVNDLVNKFALNFVSRHAVPPERLVENPGNRLQHSLGDVDVSPLLKNLLVHHGRNLCHAVLLGAVQFKRLTCGGVVVEHLF